MLITTLKCSRPIAVLLRQMTCPWVCFQGELHGARGRAVPAFVDADIVNALVTTLKHESPYCIAAAAGALCLLGHTKGGAQALVLANALPALVCVVERARPPCDFEMRAREPWRCAHICRSLESVHLQLALSVYEDALRYLCGYVCSVLILYWIRNLEAHHICQAELHCFATQVFTKA
jgi:hypothetical protein